MDHSEHGAAVRDSWGWAAFDVVTVGILAVAAVAYAVALRTARERGRWPVRRTVFWYLGLGSAAAALLGPVADLARASFTAHMVGHVLLGMVAPLLLVLAAPVTAALRALPVPAARTLTRVLRSGAVRAGTHPVTTAVLNAGGIWLLYTTDLHHLMHLSVPVYAAVHAHIFLAGYLFTASIIGADPNPHRASMRVRSAVLVAFIAAHSILAKWLYAHPPAGVGAADARSGAQLMYYGGDAVDVMLIVLLFAGWYSATRPRHPSREPHSQLPPAAPAASPRHPDDGAT